ncbi:MAG TPA: hypothetical protein VMH23_00175 [Bacteroidota bacterium]|nr:hypothetical protein [Bacteroidota bacterium]
MLGVANPDTLFKAPSRDSVSKPTQGLPQFDIPEYVITGTATIDLPDVEKQNAAEGALTLETANPVDAARDRMTIEYAPEKERMSNADLAAQNGKLLVSSGTRLTSTIGLWMNTMKPNYSLFGDAGYGVAKAYLPFTNRSEGHFDLLGSLVLRGPSDSPGGIRLLGDLSYANETYRFYGSQTPGITRSLSHFNLGAGLESPHDLLYTYGFRAGVQVLNIADSSASTTETQFTLGFRSNVFLNPIPLDAKVDVVFASLAGTNSPTLPYVDASLLTPRRWFGDFYADGALHLYITQGMLGQKFARLYPNLELGYKLMPGSVLSASYDGKVQFNTLARLIETNPYVSAGSVLRQSDIPLNLSFVLESDWDEVWRTKVSARFQSVKNYPLLTEGGLGPWSLVWGPAGPKGIWMTDYSGTTSIDSYRADVFAKFGSNGYFTMSVEVNTSKNSKTQWEVPYLPEKRIEAGVLWEAVRGLSIHPTVSFVGLRVPDLYEPSKLSEHVVFGAQATYAPTRSVDVLFEIRNLSDTKYDEWYGYRATPFVMTAGVGFRW